MTDAVTVAEARPGDEKTCSVALGDGTRGVCRWGTLMHGRGVYLPSLRKESVRVSAGGTHLLVNRYVHSIPNVRQAEDDVIAVPAADVAKAVIRSAKMQPKVFQVEGQYGPQTLAFVFVGRDKVGGATDAEAQELSKEEVQEWYTARGWPRAGRLTTVTRKGFPKAYWQMV